LIEPTQNLIGSVVIEIRKSQVLTDSRKDTRYLGYILDT